MIENYKIGKEISAAWKFPLTNWRLLLLLYVINTLFALLILTPLQNGISDSVSNRLEPDKLSFTFLSDLLSDQQLLLNGQLAMLLIGGLLYLFWLVFATSGITHYIHHNSNTLSHFWSGACSHFWKFLRLTISMLAIIGVLLFLAFLFFNRGDTNVFSIESEEIFIWRTVIILPVFALSYIFVKLWNDTLKLTLVAASDQTWFFKSSWKTWKRIFNKRLITVFIINIIITIALIAILLLINSYNLHYLVAFCLSQAMLVLRLIYKVANLKSINAITQ